ncbi:hypothetical protein L1887_23437 [Cichorium endivia]|nr:hypothetical protein L1887_23437 [Cichorium endivia]
MGSRIGSLILGPGSFSGFWGFDSYRRLPFRRSTVNDKEQVPEEDPVGSDLISPWIHGEVIGKATSKWVMINEDSRKLQKVNDDVRDEYLIFCPKAPRLAFPEENNGSLKEIAKLEDPTEFSRLRLVVPPLAPSTTTISAIVLMIPNLFSVFRSDLFADLQSTHLNLCFEEKFISSNSQPPGNAE